MPALSLGTSDLLSHVIKIGIDTYPPIQISIEQTKLGTFADEARNRWPQLFDKLESSSSEFIMSKVFRGRHDSGGTTAYPTFVLAPRGPVFAYPLLLPPPIGATGSSEDEYMELFPDLRDTFLRSVGGRDCLRIGLVRELLFNTGETSCMGLLARETSFANADLRGGKCLYLYRDDRCNVRITIEPGEIGTTTQLPVGQTVTQKKGQGLKVELDVNNLQLHALDEAEIEDVLTRARGLWPGRLLEYLNSLGEAE